MNKAHELIEQMRACTGDKEIKPLIDAFKLLPPAEKQSVTPEIIQLFEDEKVDETPRSWMPTILGAVGTEEALQYLMKRLPIERNDLFRRWICAVLVRYYSGDERISLIMQQIEREKTASNRLYMLTMLLESRSPLAVKIFIKLMDEDLGDYAVEIRRTAVRGLAQLRAAEAMESLLKRLSVEKDETILVTIIDALGAIGDSNTTSALLPLLQDTAQSRTIHLSVLQALSQICRPNDKQALDVLLSAICYSDRVVSFAATDTLLKLAAKTDAAQLVIDTGLQQDAADRLNRVADALRVIGSPDTVKLLTSIKGDSVKEGRAQNLLEQVGGKQAVEALVNQRIEALDQSRQRVRDYDAQALAIFESTVTEAKKGFVISLWMSGMIFAIGIALLVGSIYIMFQPNIQLGQQIFGVGGALTGLGSILAMFYKGPVERIERSVANLVQTEIAFLGYIRQVTQVTAMFEREYLDGENLTLEDLNVLLSYTERCVKETMPLVNQYTARQGMDVAPTSAKNTNQVL
jgi:HEAT repeat protein